jgi:ankyrin repeat protein
VKVALRGGWTALHAVADHAGQSDANKARAIELAELLVSAGADVNARATGGGRANGTPLLCAARAYQEGIARSLLRHGADPRAFDDQQATALMLAADQDLLALTDDLLQKGVDLEARDLDGKTALLHARWEKAQVGARLIAAGANVNVIPPSGWTALMEATRTRSLESVRLLLEHRADLTARNQRQETALLVAASQGATQIARLLLDGGADPNVVSNTGHTALMLAAAEGHAELVRLLLERGADRNLRSASGRTALMIAKEGHRDEVTFSLMAKLRAPRRSR